jgi:hypothetical protein
MDLKVEGQANQTIPTGAMNATSRRALTLAFILSLWSITSSNQTLPTIIDTPLGTSGIFVKKEMLLEVIASAPQPILFLTRSEINDIEEILDQHVGQQYTLTNGTLWPKLLVNEPNPEKKDMLSICECTHREYCNLCQFPTDADKLEKRT